MKKLNQLLQKHVLPGFDDEQVKRREERDMKLRFEAQIKI
jgi:syntaxin 16